MIFKRFVHPELPMTWRDLPSHRQTRHHPETIRRPETGEKPRRLIRDLVLIEERGCVEIGEDLEAAGSDAAPEILHIRQVPMRIHHGGVANPEI